MSTRSKNRSPFNEVIRQATRSHSPIQLVEPGPASHKLAKHPPLRGPSTHGLYEVGICYSGEIMLGSTTRVFHLRAGDIVVIEPGAWHYESYRNPGRPYKGCWLCATPVQMRCNFTSYSKGKFDAYWMRGLSRGGDHGSSVLDLIRQLKARRPRWKTKTRGLAIELLKDFQRSIEDLARSPARYELRAGLPMSRLGELRTRHPAKIEFEPLDKLLKIMEARFREPLDIRALAKEIDLSPNYLSSQFKKVFHTTFTNYLNVLRVWYAQCLLEDCWPIKQTATECGFQNVHYFTTVFTQKCKVTPGEYLRRCRSKALNNATS